MIQLSSKERAFLRKLAHNLEPIVRIGKDGIDENVLKSIAEVGKKREIDREMADEIARDTKSVFVDRIGKILIFFKPKTTKDAKITPEFNEFRKSRKNKK